MSNLARLEVIYNALDDSQWWPRERLVELQRVDLTRLVRHAKSTSPFYETRLDCLFRANGTIDWDRWVDVPIMTRAELSSEGDSIQTRKPIQAHGPFSWVKTSGSTGDPVKFVTTRMLGDLSLTSLWRGQKWAKMDWSATMIHMGDVSAKMKAGDVMGHWGPPWLAESRKGQRIFTSYETPMAERVALMQQYPSSYCVLGNGNALSLIEYLRENDVQIQLKGVQFRGMAANEFVRQDFRKYLNSDIVELYSSKEGGTMADPCPLGHGWHQHAESVLLEIVDSDGKPVPPGQMGRVVITPFGNTATPLIRYDHGDLAVAGPTEICPCGRTLPRIASFSGRVAHYFRKPNGDNIAWLSLDARIQLGAGIWQVARVAEDSFEVRYKKRDWGVKPDIEAFKKSFYDLYYPEAKLKIIEVDSFTLGKFGKHMELLDEWKPESQIHVKH